MIVSSYGRFAQFSQFGGAWEDWCDQKFAGDPANLAKCKGWSPFAPWTDVGAAMRGIPKPGSLLNIVTGQPSVQPAGGVPPPDAYAAPASSGSVFGIPRKLFIGGVAILGAGALAVALSKRK